jgi:predicted ATPase/DNA-binding winged helix-turn-helix (wHTH) protein
MAPPGIRFGQFELQPASRALLVAGVPVALGGRAFDVLMALVERRAGPVTKAELLDAVWPTTVVEENTLQVHVSALRKLLGPTAIVTIPGHGYRFTAALVDDGSVHPASTSPPSPPNNLPQPRSRFIGRQDALLQCNRLLQDVRLLTLTGVGGCGKTRLAMQLARQQLDGFPDGVWFVDLGTLQEPQWVARAVAAVLQVREEPGVPLLARLSGYLAGRQTLIVLDNCEHVIDAVNEVADALLLACTSVKIVATSREGLGVVGEQIFPVQPLSLPCAPDRAAIEASEAVRLFIDRACLAVPDFAVDDGNARAVTEICRRLDGIALAIELAAARVGMLSVAEINRRLNDRFRFLIGSSRALPRHQTLQATLHWSHDTLPLQEQQLFRRLAVFAGGCSLAAATAVAEDGDEYAVLALLTRLHEKSLLVVDQDEATHPRYRMLETVRQYAQERLDGAADGEAARSRHLACFVALAEEALAHLLGPEQGTWMARLAHEQENLLAAHGWCPHAVGGTDAALRLVGSMWRYWVASAQLDRGYALARTALAGADATSDPLWHCRALGALGQMAFRMGRYEESLACADHALAMAVELGDAEQTAAGLGLRAKGLHSKGHHAQALEQYEQACAMARNLKTPFWLGASLNNLAELHRSEGRHEIAEACYEEAISISRGLNSPGGTFVPLCNLARLSVASGKFERARALLLESLHIAAGAELKGMGEDLLEVAAGLASALGEYASAARFAGAALARMREGGSQREPVDEAFVAPLIERAMTALGSDGFAQAEAKGRALSHESAIIEVRRWLEGTA